MMPIAAIAGGLLGGWKKWALIGVGALAVAGYIGWLRWDLADKAAEIARRDARIASLEADAAAKDAALEEAARVAAVNAAAMRELQAESERRLAIVTAERDAALKRAGRVRTIIREVDRASDAEDGPVADVLRRTLDGLRQLQTTPADPGRNPDRTDRGA